jgi:putative CocE/NonD family hydrolase
LSWLRAPIDALAGRWLSLPAPRCRVARSDEWVTLRDGSRLDAVAFRPEAEPRCTLLVRSIGAIHARRHPLLLLARLLAEQGHAVLIAGCRGLQRCEGRFDPFRRDGEDGADLLDWLARESWCGGPQVVHGFGYAGHAAWATLASARRPVDGLSVGFASRDPYAWLHHGGALELEACFDLALKLAASEPEGVRRSELARALRHRPVIEADRVAARHIDWLREWLAHPERDAFWDERTAVLPERAPEALLIGGWYHASLPAVLADHGALSVRAERDGAPAPRLLIGPWAANPLPRRGRDREARMLRETAQAIAAFLERLGGEARRADAPVRAFATGIGWREIAHWPPDGSPRVLRLLGSERGGEDGALRDTSATGVAEPAAAASTYRTDPADAVPSHGGASLARPGSTPSFDAPSRADVLRFSTPPFERALEIAGEPRVALHVESSATHTDFAAQLLRVRPDGSVQPLGSGVARVALPAPQGAPVPVEIRLVPVWHRLAPGDVLRLELSSSCFPRFDRHPNTAQPVASARNEDGAIATQIVHHDADHPSELVVPCFAAAS